MNFWDCALKDATFNYSVLPHSGTEQSPMNTWLPGAPTHHIIYPFGVPGWIPIPATKVRPNSQHGHDRNTTCPLPTTSTSQSSSQIPTPAIASVRLTSARPTPPSFQQHHCVTPFACSPAQKYTQTFDTTFHHAPISTKHACTPTQLNRQSPTTPSLNNARHNTPSSGYHLCSRHQIAVRLRAQ